MSAERVRVGSCGPGCLCAEWDALDEVGRAWLGEKGRMQLYAAAWVSWSVQNGYLVLGAEYPDDAGERFLEWVEQG